MSLLIRWAISAFAVWVAVNFVPGISIEEGLAPLFAVALILGLVNAVVRPIVKMLACGLIFLTLGLFLLVINAVMLLVTEVIAGSFGVDFGVDGFIPALIGSVVISVISGIGSMLFGGRDDDGD
jgi:putative membrane protein